MQSQVEMQRAMVEQEYSAMPAAQKAQLKPQYERFIASLPKDISKSFIDAVADIQKNYPKVELSIEGLSEAVRSDLQSDTKFASDMKAIGGAIGNMTPKEINSTLSGASTFLSLKNRIAGNFWRWPSWLPSSASC
jgi:uncharacterized SAM-dependent methyltransferase